MSADVATPQAALYAALSKAQAEFPIIDRSKTVKVQTKTGGSYSFDYAPLEAILAGVRPVLAKHGLALSQFLDERNGGPALTTNLTHESGGILSGTVPLPSSNGNAQEFGSQITYMKRYALVAALCIATEDDDDGNHASGNTAKAKPKRAISQDAGRSSAEPPVQPTAPPEVGAVGTSSGGGVEFAPEMPFTSPTGLLTEEQNKLLGALVTELVKAGELTVEELHSYMDASYGVTTRAKLTRANASSLIEWLGTRQIA